MPFLLLIVEDAQMRQTRSSEDGRLAYDRMTEFTERLEARGVLKIADSLRPTTEGARVTVRGGKRTLVDGPFAESKEIVGGFFFLECKTKEEAVAIAGECPAAEWGTVEVREIGPCWEPND